MRDFQVPTRSLACSAEAMVATSHPIGVAVAAETLRAGGNAVDAAIAGAVVLGLAEPGSTGIGGDLFAMVSRPGGGMPYGLNACGRAPAAASAAALRAEGSSEIDVGSAHSVTVPGAIRGFERLADSHGKLGLDRLLAPSIRHAEEGIAITPRVAFDWARNAPRLKGDARRHYLIDDRAPVLGDVMRYPGQADVLRRIAERGADAFYEGEVAEDMVESLRALGGLHTLDDFAGHTVEDVTPLAAPYRGYEVLELPPNGHGATALLMLGMLERFDLASLDPLGAERAHLEIEATKLGYAARDEAIAEPSAMTMPVEEVFAPATAERLAARIVPGQAGPWPHRPLGGAPHRDTIYITVVDRDRTACSLIYSIFHAYGSGLASKRFGINFNCRGAGFTLEEGHPNELAGGKRPLHTIIPGMLRKDGEVVMSFGVMGGAYQCCGHARLLGNVLDYGMDLQAAMDAPRAFAEDGAVAVERGYAPGVREALAGMGHTVVEPEVAIGGSQAIWIDHAQGVMFGGTDPRKDGMALGL